jgi:hypothetical protein
LGAQASVAGADHSLRPLALWIGVLAGPVAWALDLTISYVLAKPACLSRRIPMLSLVTVGALLVITIGCTVAWRALQSVPSDLATDGGGELHRARFMAVLGLCSSAMFAVFVLAFDIPKWVMDGCR